MRSMLLRNVAPNVMTKLARKLATSLMKVCTDSLTPVSQANAGLKVPRLERLASSERGSLTILLKHCENDPALIPSILSPKWGGVVEGYTTVRIILPCAVLYVQTLNTKKISIHDILSRTEKRQF